MSFEISNKTPVSGYSPSAPQLTQSSGSSVNRSNSGKRSHLQTRVKILCEPERSEASLLMYFSKPGDSPEFLDIKSDRTLAAENRPAKQAKRSYYTQDC